MLVTEKNKNENENVNPHTLDKLYCSMISIDVEEDQVVSGMMRRNCRWKMGVQGQNFQARWGSSAVVQ